MSLYEASVKSDSWSLSSITRPLTTLEGWKEIGHGIFTMKSYVRTFPTRNLSQKDGSSTQRGQEKELPCGFTPSMPHKNSWQEKVRDNRSSNISGDTMVGTMSTHHKMEQGNQDNRQENVDQTIHVENTDIQPPAYTPTKRTRSLLLALVGVTAMIPSLTADMYLPATSSISRVRLCSFLA